MQHGNGDVATDNAREQQDDPLDEVGNNAHTGDDKLGELRDNATLDGNGNVAADNAPEQQDDPLDEVGNNAHTDDDNQQDRPLDEGGGNARDDGVAIQVPRDKLLDELRDNVTQYDVRVHRAKKSLCIHCCCLI